MPPQQAPAPAPEQAPTPEQAPSGDISAADIPTEGGNDGQGGEPSEAPEENGDDQEIIDAINSLGLKDKEAVLSYAESLKAEHEDAPDESEVAVDALGEGKTYTKAQINKIYESSRRSKK